MGIDRSNFQPLGRRPPVTTFEEVGGKGVHHSVRKSYFNLGQSILLATLNKKSTRRVALKCVDAS